MSTDLPIDNKADKADKAESESDIKAGDVDSEIKPNNKQMQALVKKSRYVSRILSKSQALKNRTMCAASQYVKKSIPKAVRSNVWLEYIGKKYESDCYVTWCTNIITPFSFEVGHNIPESKGGQTTIDNLRPICSQCNKSMGNMYTITQFSEMFAPRVKPDDVNNAMNSGNKMKLAPKNLKIIGNQVSVTPMDIDLPSKAIESTQNQSKGAEEIDESKKRKRGWVQWSCFSK